MSPWKPFPFAPGLQALRGLWPSRLLLPDRRTGLPHCRAGGWRKPARREKAGGAGVTGTGWGPEIAQLGSLARPASTGLHVHQPALLPSSALQTFLTNLGCCSPGRGNCRRHSTRPPETLNPFYPCRSRAFEAGGWDRVRAGWGGGWHRSRLPVSQSGESLPPHPHGWPQVMNLNQQAVSSQGFTQQTFPEHSGALDLGNQTGRF